MDNTAAKTTTETPAPAWGRSNKALFYERRDMLQRHAKLIADHGDEPEDPTAAIRLRRISRDISELTQRIVKINYGLVRSYTRVFTSKATFDQKEEYERAAVLGLVTAIDTYNPDLGTFAQYAWKQVQREVLRAVHQTEYSHMTFGDFSRRPDVLRTIEALNELDDDTAITDELIASESGATLNQVQRIRKASRHESLQTPCFDGDAELGDLIPAGERGVEEVALVGMHLRGLNDFGLNRLDARELFVLARRIGLDGEPVQRLAGIGRLLGLSREAVRQIEAKAMSRLAHPTVLATIATSR